MLVPNHSYPASVLDRDRRIQSQAFSYFLFGDICHVSQPRCHLGHDIAGNLANGKEHDETHYEDSGYNQQDSPDDVGLHFVSPCFSILS